MQLSARHLLALIYTWMSETVESFDALDESLREAAPASPETQEIKRAKIAALGGAIAS